MLKKRHNTAKVFIAMLAVLICILAVLFSIDVHVGIGQIPLIFIPALSAIIMTWAAFSLTIGRDATIVEQITNYPPDDTNSLVAGCIIDGELSSRDIISALYYLAQKGYFDIIEYEPRKFGFEFKEYPENEDSAMIMLFSAIFKENKHGEFVKLTDAKTSLMSILPKIENQVIKSIRKKKNREIADITGKVLGFKKALMTTKGDELESIVKNDKEYIYKVLPYAYAFAITSKLSSNSEHIKMSIPSWYKAYNLPDDYEFDVVYYNALLKFLPEQFKKEIINELSFKQKYGI